jgi:hypothetical protein
MVWIQLGSVVNMDGMDPELYFQKNLTKGKENSRNFLYFQKDFVQPQKVLYDSVGENNMLSFIGLIMYSF